ncbi:HIT family protein [Deinococcus peraridilitoris]|uniref:HIT family hydrolase, diadenosine tetraphosphate hydrolase n=1 Tax=Deinococcus peraridilitoris (strain DSM 19664 / LMG 22246 / CIP 109416 / KR-200) TaxID=937777 RepID=L0A2H9_DEIPD|nr:HIT family protein [Deinococcus peraridilitoris]AFZ68056.1 HIT family hydrolase, diadenosine tetraphosphate hydrolase [Deinococcus peraridilitoris DSM 19664]
MNAPRHAPGDYFCPFCEVVRGGRVARTQPEDVILHTPLVTAFIAAGWWPNNPGHVLVVPNAHFENLYDLPDEYGAEIHRVSRQVALALKAAYGCEGTSVRQHNEPGGGQDVWHYHLHVFPRSAGDDLYVLTPQRRMTRPEEREPYALKLRATLEAQQG